MANEEYEHEIPPLSRRSFMGRAGRGIAGLAAVVAACSGEAVLTSADNDNSGSANHEGGGDSATGSARIAGPGLESLQAAFDAIEVRAQSEPRLEQYRVAPTGSAGLAGVPDGWFVSRAVEHLVREGGWWSGWFTPPVEDTGVIDILLATHEFSCGYDSPTVRWALFGGNTHEESFYTPLLREQVDTAPLFGFSAQSLWASMVFPTESSMLEAFTIAYDVTGIDEYGQVNSFFVEWVTDPPLGSPNDYPEWADEQRAHELIMAASTRWSTQHRCWVDSAMPRLDHQIWPRDVVAAVLGLEPSDVCPTPMPDRPEDDRRANP